jgi:hypothetical protein
MKSGNRKQGGRGTFIGLPAERNAFRGDDAASSPVRVFAVVPRRVRVRVAAVLLLVFAFGAAAREQDRPDGDLETLDALVGRWLALRTTIAEEKRTWRTERVQWKEEIRLLEREDASLEKEIESAGSFASDVEKERAVVLARKETLDAELARLKEVLGRAEAALCGWETRIPPGMRKTLSGVFRALPATHRDAGRTTLAKRAQNVATLYTGIESLGQKFHATHEILEVSPGERRRVEVLYAGLARGFAVSPGDDWAAVGVSTPEGWRWTPRPGLAVSVRLALEVLKREKTARMVFLPMQATEETGS